VHLSLPRAFLFCAILIHASVFAGDEDNFDTETLNKNAFLALSPDNFPCSEELNKLKPLFALADASTSHLRGNGLSITFFAHFFAGKYKTPFCSLTKMGQNEQKKLETGLFDFFSKSIAKLPGLEHYQNFFVEFTLNDKPAGVNENEFKVSWHRDSSALPTEFVIVLNVESNYPDHDFTLGKVAEEHRRLVTNAPVKSSDGLTDYGEEIPEDKIDVLAQIPVKHNYGYLINEQVGLADKSCVYHATTIAQFPVGGPTADHTRKTLIVRATPIGTDTHNRLALLYLKTNPSLAQFMQPFVKAKSSVDSSSDTRNDTCTTTASSTVSNTDPRDDQVENSSDVLETVISIVLLAMLH
jgi:hypothetical protein